MPSFKKKDVELIDFTQLKKRGLLKETPETTRQSQQTPDFFDFTKQNSPQQQIKQEPNPLSFLDTFAQNATQTPTSQVQTNNSDFIIKLENLEYQLERLSEKLATIEEKIAKFEERVSQ